MQNCVIGFVIGLIIGWNVFPQPAWVKQLYDRVTAKVKDLLGINS